MPVAAIARADHATRFTSERSLAIWKKLTPEERKARSRYARSKVIHLARHFASPIADMHNLVRECGPTPAETRLMLKDLIAAIGPKRAAACISLPSQHFIALSNGRTAGSPSLRKHVWSVWCLCLRPGWLADWFTWMTAGRFTKSAGPQHAGRVAASAGRSEGGSSPRRGRSPDAS